jgi:hypothetical protein
MYTGRTPTPAEVRHLLDNFTKEFESQVDDVAMFLAAYPQFFLVASGDEKEHNPTKEL